MDYAIMPLLINIINDTKIPGTYIKIITKKHAISKNATSSYFNSLVNNVHINENLLTNELLIFYQAKKASLF